ncbi:MAG: hypothetical protein KF725_16660 [Cyclobacteriaceae bacterium]|nr:hypothetical protein [Cyclobacteriaceae bacterium]UYN87665.1 MAG: hypothetical protein KIT51_05235 [Cyclobacteriaceae bacterium]
MILFNEKEKQAIAVITIIAGLLALACLLLGFIATEFDDEAFANPAKILNMPSVNVNYLRWFMILDMFGYYLLLLPVIFFLHRELAQITAWASMLTSMGYGYVLVGAIGASVLAVVWPDLITQYRLADAVMKEILKADFLLITNVVVKGFWNYLEVLLGGVWWIGVGHFAIRNRALKVTTLVLGIACLIDGIGELFQISLLAEIGLNVYLLLGIVWPVWMGLTIMKNKI